MPWNAIFRSFQGWYQRLKIPVAERSWVSKAVNLVATALAVAAAAAAVQRAARAKWGPGTRGLGELGMGKTVEKTMKDLMELQMSEKALVTRMYKKINLEGDVWWLGEHSGRSYIKHIKVWQTIQTPQIAGEKPDSKEVQLGAASAPVRRHLSRYRPRKRESSKRFWAPCTVTGLDPCGETRAVARCVTCTLTVTIGGMPKTSQDNWK